jgi:alanine racemase
VKITELRNLPKGSKISYNCTHVLEKDSQLALLPIGYFDGISRVNSNQSFALVGGNKVRQLGRVTMNSIILDVTGVQNVKVGDEAVIIGSQGGKNISATDLGDFGETSSYEALTRINPGIIRKVV